MAELAYELVPLDEEQPATAAPAVAGNDNYELVPLEEPAPKHGMLRSAFDWATEAQKGAASGLVETTGAGIKGVAGQQQLIQQEETEIARDRLRLLDRIDRGEDLGDVPYRDAKTVRDYQSMTPEARAEMRRQYQAAETNMQPGDIRKNPIFQFGQATQKWSQEKFAPAKDYENSWTRLITQGLGSTIPFAVMPEVAGVVAGSTISAGQQIDDAIAKGATREQIIEAVRYGQLPGMTETLPIDVLFSRIPPTQYGKFVDALIKVGAQVLAEGGQEAGQQFAQNLIAKFQYNPNQDLTENVAISGAVGGAVGGIMAAPSAADIAARETKDKQNQAADQAQPPGTTVAPNAGVATPGGTGVSATAPPPAGAATQQPGVTTVAPGTVPLDVGAALTREQPPAAAPAQSEVALPTTPAPAPAVEAVEEEPDVAPEEETAEGEVSPEEQARRDEFVRRQKEQEAQAAATPVTPAGADEAAALTAAAKSRKRTKPAAEPLPTPQAQTAIGMAAEPQRAIVPPLPSVAPQIPPIQAVSEQEAGTQPPVLPQPPAPSPALNRRQQLVRALRERGMSPEEIVSLEDSEIEELLQEAPPVEQPPLAPPPVEPAPAPVGAPQTGFDLVPLSETAQQPSAPLATAPAAPAPQLSPIGRQLAQRLEVETGSSLPEDLLSRPDLRETIGTVASELTRAVPKGQAPNQVISQVLPQALAEVRQRLEAGAATEAAQEEARAAAALEQSARTQEKAKVEGAPQERARKPRTKGKEKSAGAFAAQGEKALFRRAEEEMTKPEAEREAELVDIHRLREARKKTGARSKEKAILTKEIKARQQDYARKLATREEAAAADKPKPESRPEPEPRQAAPQPEEQLTEEEKVEQARQRQEGKRKARTDKLDARLQPVIDATPDFVFPGSMKQLAEKGSAYIKDLLARLNAAVGDTKLYDDVSPDKAGMLENFTIWAKKRLGKAKSPAQIQEALLELWPALKFLKEGDRANLYGLISNEAIDARPITDSSMGLTLDERNDLGDVETSDALAASEWSGKHAQPMLKAKTVTIEDTAGQPVQIKPVYSEKSGGLLAQLQRAVAASGELARGPYGVWQRLHYAVLRNMVGDVPVHWISDADMKRVYGSAYGLFYQETPTSPPSILLNQDAAMGKGLPHVMETLAHEMTHAATVYAMAYNIRGTQQIVSELRQTLETLLKVTGQYDLLDSSARNAFKNDAEFVAEAMNHEEFQIVLQETDVPDVINRQIAGLGQPRTSFWRAFGAAVANALGFRAPQAVSYFDAMLRVYPHMAMTRSEQLTDFRGRKVSPTSAARPFDAAHARSAIGEAYEAFQERVRRPAGRFIWRNFVSTQQLVRDAEDYGADAAEAVRALSDIFQGGHHQFQQELAPSLDMVAKLAHLKNTDHQEFARLAEVVWHSTNNETDASQPLHQGNNKHVFKKGVRHRQKRANHKRDQALYAALKPDSKKLYGELRDHYQRVGDRKMEETVRTIVDNAVGRFKLTLPQGETIDSVVKWVLDGDIDRPPPDPSQPLPQPGTRTPRDTALHKALGGTGKTLANSHEMRRIRGYYAPLMRRGKYFLSARETVPVPQGAYRQSGTGDDVELVFDGPDAEKNYNAWADSTDNHISRAVVEHRHKTTGARISARDVNAVKQLRAYVQNRYFEMSDDPHALERRRQELLANGYAQVDAVDEVDRLGSHASALLPAQLSAVIRSIEQGNTGSSTVGQKAVVAGVVSAFLRQQGGSRAGHRRLKRHNVKGFDQDLVQAAHDAAYADAGHIANISRARQLDAADSKLEEILKDTRRQAKGGMLGLRSIVNELRRRIRKTTNDGADNYGALGSGVRTVTEVTYLNRLAGPSFTLSQIAQLPMMTWPVLARRYPKGAVLREMTRAFKAMSPHRVGARGILETAAEAKGAVLQTMGRQAYPRKQLDWVGYARKQLAGQTNAALKLKVYDRLEELGFGVGAGIEPVELSEYGRWAGGRALTRISRVARSLPVAAELVNRLVTLSAAVDLGKRAGLSDEQILQNTIDDVEASQGGYSQANNARIFAGPAGIGRVPFQFKKFSALYGQLYYGALSDVISNPAERKEAAKQLARLSLSTAVFAGVRGLAILELVRIGVMAAGLFGLGDGDWEDWENAFQKWFGDAVDWAFGGGGETTSEAVFSGASRLAGFDLSSRLGNDALIAFGQPRSDEERDVKSWLFNLFSGAPGGVASDTVKAIHNRDYTKLPLPKLINDLIKLPGTYREQGAGAAVTRAFGFRTAEEARKWEAYGEGAATKAEQKMKAARTDLMGRYAALSPGERQKFWNDEIKAWNRAHKDRTEKIEYGDLQRSIRKRKQDAKAKARKQKQREKQ